MSNRPTKHAFPSGLLIWAPDHYGSNPHRLAQQADEIIAEVKAANPDVPDPDPTRMQVVHFGGPVRKRIFGIEWLLPGYTPPEGYVVHESGPSDHFNHL